MVTFSIIAAVDEERGIGKSNFLPWRLPADLKYFSEKTASSPNNWVIMGRNTWESLPAKHRPLPGRRNLVITRQEKYLVHDVVMTAGSLDEALKIIERQDHDEVFVIGGAQIFAGAIKHPALKTMYLTEIEGTFDCDTFFPEFDKSTFMRTEDPRGAMQENRITFRFVVYNKQ
ncbi:dihydrofolate reductase [Candidatus Gracilibacteria bacterium]|nr:dihydrofolate reductase [Candidatus Gracilibacteria bacterium]